MNELRHWIEKLLTDGSVSTYWIPYITTIGLLLITLLLIFVSLYITRELISRLVHAFIFRTKSTWDDMLIKHRLFPALARLVAVIILVNAVPVVFEDFSKLLPYIGKLVQIYFILVIVKIIVAFMNGTEDYLSHSELFIEKPISSWFQLVRILIYITAGILCLSILLGRSPLYFLGAFGAMTAVLLLVFKDTILGLVASIQIASNDMIRVGDWVEMPKYNADGDVIAINLNTVKVRNWDKTISTVPTHYFITDSFKNWRGMQESGGRRIKRSIQINASSICFVTPALREEFKKIDLIRNYITERQSEIELFNDTHKVSGDTLINGRRMTNIGVFRKYIEAYLRNHPGINQQMTLIVRQLTSAETGLPIEVYCFTNTVKWVEYETIQSDIFDHLFAAVSQFRLKVFQSPSGSDIIQSVEKLRAL